MSDSLRLAMPNTLTPILRSSALDLMVVREGKPGGPEPPVLVPSTNCVEKAGGGRWGWRIGLVGVGGWERPASCRAEPQAAVQTHIPPTTPPHPPSTPHTGTQAHLWHKAAVASGQWRWCRLRHRPRVGRRHAGKVGGQR